MNKNMNIVLILFALTILYIKCEGWRNEVNGHSKGDYDNGYAGKYDDEANDFYLCSERRYRVHYSGDNKDIWSEEFSACQPAGICKGIDALAISGGRPYMCRTGSLWPDNAIFDYDIHNSTGGYAGKIGSPIVGILIYGNEYYRVSDTHEENLCSYERVVAKRIVNNLFGKNLIYNYDNETKIEIQKNENINVSVILLKPYNINQKGNISIKIEKSRLAKNNYRGIITQNYIDIINEIIEFDYSYIKNFFEDQFKNGMYNGDIAINFNWINKIIIIEVGSKIDSDHYCYRGGFKINIYLNDEEKELLQKIKKICKIFIRYSGKRIPDFIKKLLSDFNSFEKVNEIINFLDGYSNIVEEVIFFTILEKILDFKK